MPAKAKKAPVPTPTALPQLTRVLPVELKAVRKEKKPAATEASVRALLAAFALEHPNEAATWRRLVADAKRLNIAIDPAKTPELTAWRAAAEAEPDPDDEDDEEERDADMFEMSFSSETAVPRWFGEEILDHSTAAVDMSRAGNGLSYLVDHDTGDQVGIIENLRLEGGKTRGTVRFSRAQRAQDIKRDVQDGIRPFTSIGYRVMDMVLERETDDENGTSRVYRVTRWMPMEASTVSVPADYTVGPGRSAKSEEFPISVRSAVQSAGATPPPSIEVRTMNPKEMAEIFRLCKTHGVDDKRTGEIIETEGMTADKARGLILSEVEKRTTVVPTPGSENSDQTLSLTEREQKEYSICRGVMTMVKNAENKSSREASFETEISDELAKRHDGKQHGGLFVPYKMRIDPSRMRAAIAALGVDVLSRAGISTALTAGTATKGSEIVFTEPGPFINFLYNMMRLKELGAQTVSGLQGNIAFPKQNGKASGSWVGENPGTDVADSNLLLTQVTMSPKTYQSSTAYSRQLLAQGVVDVDSLVRMDLARDCALAIDSAGISGTGSSDDPKGILSTSGVTSYTTIADVGNGGKAVWDDITFMLEELEDANADQVGDFGWLTTPGVKGLFKRTPRLVYSAGAGTTVNVTGDPIWASDNSIDGYDARSSNQVPKTLTKGGSNNCHALIVGVFSALVNGLWGSGFELVVDPYRLKKQGLIELTTFILTDWANRYPAAFIAAKDVLTA